MNIKAKKIRITFDNSSEDNWEATCGGGIEFDDAMRMIARAWREYDEPKKPAEPLIKDEKVRKAVRAWAEANEVFGASTYKSCSDAHYWYIRAFNDTENGIDIDFWGELPKELIDCKYYTIAELCGESKEDDDEA